MKQGSGKIRIPEAAPVGILAVAMALILVLTAYVRLYETASENAQLSEELEALLEEQAALQTAYDEATDTQRIYLEATQRLHMTEPASWQIRTVTLPLQDRAEVLTAQTPTALDNLKTNLRAAFADIYAYLS